MAKIVLVNPSFEPIYVYDRNSVGDPPNIPRAMVALGTYLEERGHRVKIFDVALNPGIEPEIVEEAKDAEFVGFGVMSCSIISSLKISQMIKEKTKAKTVWGGIHPTFLPKQTCEDSLVDYVIHGEGEDAILELLEEKDLTQIKNLSYKTEGKVMVNPRRDYLNLNKMPSLNFELVDVDRYITRTLVQTKEKVRMLPVISSRGCPHRCSFCIHVIANDRPYRMQDVDITITEIKRLKEEYQVQAIKFAEDNFFVNRKRVKAICEKMKGMGLKWVGECRADYFREGHVDEELLQLMKESGCAGFTIGAESGSQKMLNLLKKDIVPEDVVRAAKACYKYNFVPSISFIIGMPGETKKDVHQTVNLIIKAVKECPIMIGGIGPYRPQPGDYLYEYCFQIANLKTPSTLRDWTKPEYLDLVMNASYIPWNEHADYISNVVYYAGLYLFTNRRLGIYIKRDVVRGLGFSVFVMLARLRCKTKFFYLPWDRKLFNLATRLAGQHIMNFAFGSRKKIVEQAAEQTTAAGAA